MINPRPKPNAGESPEPGEFSRESMAPPLRLNVTTTRRFEFGTEEREWPAQDTGLEHAVPLG